MKVFLLLINALSCFKDDGLCFNLSSTEFDVASTQPDDVISFLGQLQSALTSGCPSLGPLSTVTVNLNSKDLRIDDIVLGPSGLGSPTTASEAVSIFGGCQSSGALASGQLPALGSAVASAVDNEVKDLSSGEEVTFPVTGTDYFDIVIGSLSIEQIVSDFNAASDRITKGVVTVLGGEREFAILGIEPGEQSDTVLVKVLPFDLTEQLVDDIMEVLGDASSYTGSDNPLDIVNHERYKEEETTTTEPVTEAPMTPPPVDVVKDESMLSTKQVIGVSCGAVGAIGVVGAGAYFGFRERRKGKKGEGGRTVAETEELSPTAATSVRARTPARRMGFGF